MRGGSRDAGWVDAAPRDPTKPPSYVPIAAELLRRLYVDEELTVDEIAPRLGCATTTVFRRLRSFAIPGRPTGPIPRRHIHGIGWDPEVAYAVGLIATDGNLSRDGRHMSVTSKDRDLIGVLRYAKQKSISLLRWIYYAPTVPCLGRKRATAERFLHPLGHASERPVGRPRVGWLYNTRQPGRSEGTR